MPVFNPSVLVARVMVNLANDIAWSAGADRVTWDNVVYDIGGWFDPMNPQILMTPGGVNYLQYSVGIWNDAPGGNQHLTVGEDIMGAFEGRLKTTDVSAWMAIPASPIIPTVQGRQYYVEFSSFAPNNVYSGDYTFFCINGFQ